MGGTQREFVSANHRCALREGPGWILWGAMTRTIGVSAFLGCVTLGRGSEAIRGSTSGVGASGGSPRPRGMVDRVRLAEAVCAYEAERGGYVAAHGELRRSSAGAVDVSSGEWQADDASHSTNSLVARCA